MIRRVGLHLAVIGSYLGLALLHLRPLGSVLGSAIARGNREDALLHGWILNWTSRRLLRAPWNLFDANCFFPFPRSLAYTEHFIPEALLVVPVQALTGDPILTYNVAFLLSFVLWGWGTFLLVRRLTGSAWAGWVAGAFACWFPAKRWSLAHLNTISLQWVPFALLALDRLLARPRLLLALTAGVAVALASLSSAYYTVYFPLMLLAAVPLLLWASGHPLDRRRAGGVALAAVIAALAALPVLWTYGSLYGQERGQYEYLFVPGSGADVADFFVLDSWLWTPLLVSRFSVRNTAAFFPGAVAIVLGALALLGRRGRGNGLRASWRGFTVRGRMVHAAGAASLAAALAYLGSHLVAHHRAWLFEEPAPAAPWTTITFLALGGVGLIAAVERGRFPILLRHLWARILAAPRGARAFTLLALLGVVAALGQQLQFFGYLGLHLPVYWLYRMFPLLASLRAPFRIGFLAMAFFAVVVGFGAARLLQQARQWRLGVAATSVLLVVLMQLEYLGPVIEPVAPPAARPVDRWLADEPGAFGVMELPQPQKMWQTARQQWRSVYHWKRRVTGHNGFVPGPIKRLHLLSRPILGQDFVDLLVEGFPVRYLLLDLDGLSMERRAWALAERLPQLAPVLEPIERFGSVQVMRVNNGGRLGALKRRFPRWMIRGVLRIELAVPPPETLRGARVIARLGTVPLGSADLRSGERYLEIPVPTELGDDEMPWLHLRLVPRGAPAVMIRRIQFVHSDGSRYP